MCCTDANRNRCHVDLCLSASGQGQLFNEVEATVVAEEPEISFIAFTATMPQQHQCKKGGRRPSPPHLPGLEVIGVASSTTPYPFMNLAKPALGLSAMAAGMGVGGEVVTSPDAIRSAVERALACDGPYLIDLVVEGLEYRGGE